MLYIFTRLISLFIICKHVCTNILDLKQTLSKKEYDNKLLIKKISTLYKDKFLFILILIDIKSSVLYLINKIILLFIKDKNKIFKIRLVFLLIYILYMGVTFIYPELFKF